MVVDDKYKFIYLEGSILNLLKHTLCFSHFDKVKNQIDRKAILAYFDKLTIKPISVVDLADFRDFLASSVFTESSSTPLGSVAD